MFEDSVRNEYFEWMIDTVCKERYSKDISYRKLLMFLHTVPFRYSVQKDANRYEDGKSLRWRFACDKKYDQPYLDDVLAYLDGPCSVLEMILALAIRCEESIMDDPAMGDRTKQWFWGMIANLGLGDMTDERFEKDTAIKIITRFLNRKYSPEGVGGLFTVRNSNKDLRTVEIWYQLCYYLDNIV